MRSDHSLLENYRSIWKQQLRFEEELMCTHGLGHPKLFPVLPWGQDWSLPPAFSEGCVAHPQGLWDTL